MTNIFSSRVLVIAAAIVALSVSMPRPSAAQTRKAATATSVGACRYSPGDAWVARQAEFFDDSKHDWSDDTLRTALLKAAGITASLKAPVHNGVEIAGQATPLGPTADAMIDALKKLGAVRGATWPTKSVVGAAGTHAVYLLAQHDTALGRTVLKHMMEAGPTESPAIDVAVFEDHMRLIWGRKQLYGTQFRKTPDGKVVLAAMEDSAHADLRRGNAGLPPFALGLCFARETK